MLIKVRRIFFKLVLSFTVFIVHIGLANILPNPWNNLNILLLISIWLIINREYFSFIKYLFIISLISELFHSTPFGLITATLFLTIIIFDWFLLNILTNRFFLMVWVAGFLSTISYQIIFIFLIYIKSYFSGMHLVLNQGFYMQIIWSSIINGSILTIAYLIYILYHKKYNPSYLAEYSYANRKHF